MGRRRKRDDDWIGLVAQLVGMVFLLSLISPQVRHTISAIGFIAICLTGMVVVGLIAFGVYRWVSRSAREAPSSTSEFGARTAPVKTTISIPQVESSAQVGSLSQTNDEILEQLRSIDWFQFEKLVALAYRKLGYTVTRGGGANPDGGIDLLIEKNGRRSAVQCKQWKTWNVGVRAVREFLGALTDAGIENGIFITLCGYTGEAQQLAAKHKIEIINETGLAQILESTNASLDPEVLSILRDTRKFCPKCESEMVLRTATTGMGAGKKFWGCSAYPKCRSTMPAA